MTPYVVVVVGVVVGVEVVVESSSTDHLRDLTFSQYNGQLTRNFPRLGHHLRQMEFVANNSQVKALTTNTQRERKNDVAGYDASVN